MKVTRVSRHWHLLVWLLWVLLLLDSFLLAAPVFAGTNQFPNGWPCPQTQADLPLLTGVVPPDGQLHRLFPWWPKERWRKLALRHYLAAQETLRRARWAYRRAWVVAHLARGLIVGALTFAGLVDLLTRSQLRRHLGALPVLYALLETLQVRQIINRHCPTAAQVDHGTVALVLVLNRLTAPRGLYLIADWLAQTVLVQTLGLSPTKFNDDRLGRALEALAEHARDIWLDVVQAALLRLDLDLHFLFYDLTAFVLQGEYADSALADFGFAHNTPSGKRKLKVGVSASRDGGLPLEYAPWSGRTADVATVQDNLERLSRLLARQGSPIADVVLIGDRATLNDELAFAYDRQGLRYLAGLQPRKKVHQALLTRYPDSYFKRQPLGQAGYWGLPCEVAFEHEGQKATHRGLVVLSGPMQLALRKTRAKQLRALRQALAQVQAKIGQRDYRTVAQVQRHAQSPLADSPVGKLLRVWASESQGQVQLHWQLDRAALLAAMRHDGRYLLVTNHPGLNPSEMLAHYRQKDQLEKRFRVSKQDLRVCPIYLHQDQRIQGMLLVNMLALLAYSVLERQLRQHGLALTTRRLIARLESLTVIETECWDGSVLERLTPVDAEQAKLLEVLAVILDELRWPRLRSALPAEPEVSSLPRPLPAASPPLPELLAA